ncbi:DUF4387 domain-containing protein [Phenylobacterium sp. VNQ135]|uniref:DUF4387 domain-containing protein n=1 Tax=Phenylobacterium sp. VNQ135 TaxID=3400922 RepID=UPI003C06745E
MPKLGDVCRFIRSKNAGPYWITVDLFFDAEGYAAYADAPGLSPEALARAAGVEPGDIRKFLVPALHVVKVTYPRKRPQGGVLERDLHGGQQFVQFQALEV